MKIIPENILAAVAIFVIAVMIFYLLNSINYLTIFNCERYNMLYLRLGDLNHFTVLSFFMAAISCSMVWLNTTRTGEKMNHKFLQIILVIILAFLLFCMLRNIENARPLGMDSEDPLRHTIFIIARIGVLLLTLWGIIQFVRGGNSNLNNNDSNRRLRNNNHTIVDNEEFRNTEYFRRNNP